MHAAETRTQMAKVAEANVFRRLISSTEIYNLKFEVQFCWQELQVPKAKIEKTCFVEIMADNRWMASITRLSESLTVSG